jgi:hypothetical protein
MQRSPAVYWAGAAVALSPTIAHSVELFADESWPHYVVVAPLLLAICLLNDDGAHSATPNRRIGGGIIALALAVQLVGIASGSWSIARIGLPLAALGVALAVGRPPPLPMILCFWLIPAPNFLVTAATPWAESVLADVAARVVSTLGADVSVSGPLIQIGDAPLELTSAQGGIVTALVLAELGWYSAARDATPSWLAASRRVLLYGSAVAVVQPTAAIVAVLILWWVGSTPAELWMSHGVWLLVAVTCAAEIERKRGNH